jgi:hypothetical protein
MNSRTRWLLLAALAVFGIYGIDQIYRTQIEEPSNRLNSDLDRLTAQLQESNDAEAVARKTLRRLDGYQHRALPYEPQLARSAYQRWLLGLVNDHQIQSASVDAAQPRPIELRSRMDRRKRIPVGHSILYSLRGKATLAQWTQWMIDFRRAGHLHKVRGFTLNPLGTEGQLDGSLTIEVLSLASATRKDGLSDWLMASTDELTQKDYGEFVRRNLFARGFAQALFDIQLKAITFDRSGRAEAWFQIDDRGTMHSTKQTERLPLALHDIVVAEIQQDKVLIEVNRDPYWISMGQNVGEVCNSEQQQD